jgi:hypothetical protein
MHIKNTSHVAFHPIYGAILELHEQIKKWLAPVRSPVISLNRIHRATLNSALTFRLASRGHRERHHLRQTMESVEVCSELMWLLFLDGRIDEHCYDEARRRTDQIATALAALNELPHERWIEVELPNIEPKATDGQKSFAATMRERILARVAELSESTADTESVASGSEDISEPTEPLAA